MAKKKGKAKSGRGFRRARAIFLLLLIVSAPFWGRWVYKWGMSYLSQGESPWNGINFGASQPPSGQWAVAEGNLYYLQNGKLNAVNGAGKPLWEKAVLLGADGLRYSDGTLLVSSKASLGVERYSPEGKLVGRVKAPGQFEAVLESDKGLLFTNTQSGMYRWMGLTGSAGRSFQVSEGRILLTRVHPITGDTVVAALRGGQGAVETILIRYDSEGHLLGARTFQDSVLVDAGFVGKNLIVVLDSGIMGIDDQMKDLWAIREGARYYQTAFGEDVLWVHRMIDGQTTPLLQCINEAGKILNSHTEEGDTVSMAISPQRKLALSNGHEIRVVDNKGKSQGSFTPKETVTNLAWINNDTLVLQYKSRIEMHRAQGGFER